jgi:hypothetical protein
MQTFFPRSARFVFCLQRLFFACLACAVLFAWSTRASSFQEAKQSRQPGPTARLPRQQAQNFAALDGVVKSGPSDAAQSPVSGAVLTLRNVTSNVVTQITASGDGVFRAFPLAPGEYTLTVHADGFSDFALNKLTLRANEVLTLEVTLAPSRSAEVRSRLPRLPELGPPLVASAESASGSYREFHHRLDSDPNYVLNPAPESLPPAADIFAAVPDRWALPQPEYQRYPASGEHIYTKPRWYDPFNHNRFKGDEPIWPSRLGQQVFLNITATSDTTFDARRVPSPSNVSAANPGSDEFFGRGEQEFLDQTLRFSFDLFHGDTSFKPADWRIRITPEVSINNLNVRELGIVRPDVRSGTNRFDTHLGLQEAFAEVKLRDLGPNYQRRLPRISACG